jgi:cytochrome c-type biogenesis protein CcmH
LTIGQQQENISIFHDRLNELEQEKVQGTLTQTAFEKLKIELEKNLLQDTHDRENKLLTPVDISGKHWLLAFSLGVAVAVTTLSMYFDLGRSGDLLISQSMAEQAPQNTQAKNEQPPSMESAIQMLEEKLTKDPNNREKQYLLVNSYSALGQFAKAADMYADMVKEAEPGSEEFARLKGGQAQAAFQASGERMTLEIKTLVNEALKADSQEPSSLMLLGINAFSATNYEQAISFWQKAKVKAGDDQKNRFIDPAIVAAQEKMGVATKAPVIAAAEEKKLSTNTPSLIIDLTLNDTLKSKVTGDDIIFVFARPVGGRMPLAAERIKVKDLPARIVLDDTKAAMPTAKLSSVDEVEVTARVSLSGKPMKGKGDLYAEVKKVIIKGNVSLAMEINQVVE